MSFLGGIKRREVFQVAAVYAVLAWLLVQIVDIVNEPLGLPDWFDTVVIVLFAVGFPIVVILAWAFDVSPQGIKAAADDQFSNYPAQPAGQSLGLLAASEGNRNHRSLSYLVTIIACGIAAASCDQGADREATSSAEVHPDLSGQYDDSSRGPGSSPVCRVGLSRDDCDDAPFTSQGEATANAFDRAAYQEVYATTCTVAHMPEIISPGRYLLRIDQGDDLVTIYHQRTDTARIIRMTAEPPPPELPHTRLGYAVGRWDGDTLVIETSHVIGGSVGNSGFPYSEQARIIERYSREPGQEQTLVLEATLDDPVNYTSPFVLFRYELISRPDFEWLPWNCSLL